MGSRKSGAQPPPLLTESGLVRAMDFGKDQTYYDPNYADHWDDIMGYGQLGKGGHDEG